MRVLLFLNNMTVVINCPKYIFIYIQIIDDGRIKVFKFGGSVWRIAKSDLNEFIFMARQYQVLEGK